MSEKARLGGGEFSTPYASHRKVFNPDDFDIEAIRRPVHSYYDRKEYPTLSKVIIELQEKDFFSGERITVEAVKEIAGG